MPKVKFKKFSEALLDFIEISVIGATIFILVYLFVGQLLEVSGDSMHPTLIDGEQLIAEKVSMAVQPLTREEIVIFRHPEKRDRLLIKRVIGLPGDVFRFEDGNVILNGEPLSEPYLVEEGHTFGSDVYRDNENYSVQDESYLLLGDNRNESADSRSFGTIKGDLIIGRALLVYHPFSNFRVIEH